MKDAEDIGGLIRAVGLRLRKKDRKSGEQLLNLLRESFLDLAARERSLSEENQFLKRAQETQNLRLAKLRTAFDDIVSTYQASLSAFSKFRKGIRIVQMAESFKDLPAALEDLRELFGLRAANLILSEELFGEFARGYVDLRNLQECEGLLRSIFRSEEDVVYLGRVDALETPSLLVGEKTFFRAPDIRTGSCFIYRMPHKLAPDSCVGLLVFCDADPKRYAADQASDYLELFGDVLAVAMVDMAEQIKARALREDMERITRHDLKNPLNSVIGIPQILIREPNMTADQRELLALLQKSGYIMLDMINLSMDLYRMEQGTYDLRPTPVDLAALAERTLADQRIPIRDMELRTEITVRGRPTTKADSFCAPGEKLLCYSMLANLVRNAVEASPAGGWVEVALEEEGDWRLVCIRNAGAVPVEVRDRFFEKYVTAGKRRGSGLGTYSARLIAQTLGGSIEMQTSDEDASTTVTVRLPGC